VVQRKPKPVPIPKELVPTVERGVVALADELGVEIAEVLPVNAERAEPMAEPEEKPAETIPELVATRIGLVSGLRQSTRETLAGHSIGTVAEALEQGRWLDELIGSQQAERLRRYARGE
jgi:hypothetical protein